MQGASNETIKDRLKWLAEQYGSTLLLGIGILLAVWLIVSFGSWVFTSIGEGFQSVREESQKRYEHEQELLRPLNVIKITETATFPLRFCPAGTTAESYMIAMQNMKPVMIIKCSNRDGPKSYRVIGETND